MRIRPHVLLAGACCLLLLAPALSRAQGEQESSDRTLAPYFFVDGDPSVDHLPLKSTDVDVRIAGVIADVSVAQTYQNEGSRPIEARYVFPGSTRAAVYAMRMRVGNRLIEAQIREKRQARAEYDAARREGKTASLLEQHRPNVFQTKVANILPGDRVTVELRYTELLVPTDGKYQFVYPTVVGPRYNGAAGTESHVAERWVASPYLHEGEPSRSAFDLKVAINSPIPLKEVGSASHQLQVQYEGANRAVVSLTKTGTPENNRDFILDYRLSGDRVESGLLLYRGKDENFFLAMVEPPAAFSALEILPREYIFILDVSGSMHGFPLDTAKVLLHDLLGHLQPVDSFNLLLFSGGNSVLAERSQPATPANLQRALALINAQRGGGGTELLPALRRALSLPRDESRSLSIVIITDGYVTVETEAFDLIRENLGAANVFTFGIGSSVNRHLLEGMARAGKGEPFVVTSGERGKQEAARFRRYIESPVLSHLKARFEGFDAYAVEPEAIPDVFASRPVILFGKWRGERQGTLTIDGITGSGPHRQSLDLGAAEPREDNASLKYLWARSRIQTLSDYSKLAPDDERVQEITRLGLKYSLLTQYTSFVAIDRVVRNVKPNDQASVDQPSPMPEGVSDLAIGQNIPSTPEPETWALLAVALGTLLFLGRAGILPVRRSPR
ncbi:MAG TPA: VIT and VWA domain-containing protein [Candidatus Methylomirabilis sp.]|nr:VIT and VWA domain-containing protein [Candidatus Methylomirabilis sp.]